MSQIRGLKSFGQDDDACRQPVFGSHSLLVSLELEEFVAEQLVLLGALKRRALIHLFDEANELSDDIIDDESVDDTSSSL